MKRSSHLGPFSANSAHLPHYVAPRIDLSDVPQRIVNASSREPLSLSKMWAGSESRPGSQDHRQFKSLRFSSPAPVQDEEGQVTA